MMLFRLNKTEIMRDTSKSRGKKNEEKKNRIH